MNPRALFRPKVPEVPTQCASCPFRFGNEKEFGEIVAKVRKLGRLPGRVTKQDVFAARMRIWMDVQERGDFLCHGTVYGPDMMGRPQSNWRQCKGATASFHTGRFYPDHKCTK